VSDKQIEDFIQLIDDGVAIKDAASMTGIKLGSAYNYRKPYIMDPNEGVPYKKKRRRKRSYYKLKEEHAKLIITYIYHNPRCNLC
jgi:hypothetical protein